MTCGFGSPALRTTRWLILSLRPPSVMGRSGYVLNADSSFCDELTGFVIAEIERTSEEPDAVLRIGNLLRVREDALMRWISGQGVAGGPTLPPPTARTMPPLRRTRRRVGQDACGDPSGP